VFHDGGGLPLILGLLSSVVSVVAGAVALVLVLGLLFLLVRFLWFGTRAAQLYLAKNGESPRFSWPPRPFEESGTTDTPSPATPRRPKAPPAPPAPPAD
jgi:hypothetical protein